MHTGRSQLVSFTVAMLFSLVAASAQDSAQDRDGPANEELRRRRDQKLASAFLGKAAWRTNLAQALAESRSSKRLVFAYFSRSYAP